MFQRGAFATNLEKLLLYSLDDGNSISEDSKKIIVKIYDHSQLALHQIENVNNIFADTFPHIAQSNKTNFSHPLFLRFFFSLVHRSTGLFFV